MADQKLIQFWDSKSPPEEVARLMETWASAPGFAYTRFNTDTAADFIGEHLDRDALEAFRLCRIPAMQADFFRYCALYVLGGAYVDADTLNGGGLDTLVAGAERGVLMNRRGRIANDFLYFAAPKDPLLEHVIRTAIANISGRISENVWEVTGPGIMTKLYEDSTTLPMFDGFDIRDVREIRTIVVFQWEMEYKKGEDDWRNAQTGSQSIFRDPAA